jgi:tetratricopeptide (TPR) repeat protein
MKKATASKENLTQTPFWESTWFGMLSVALLAFAAFQGAIMNGFVFFDDDKAILYNQTIQNPSLKAFFTGQNLGMYAPLTWIAYWAGIGLSGEEAWGHHLIAVLLHAMNAVLVYSIIRNLFGRAWPALFAAALFAVHPIQTEAVAWAAALSTVLFSSFYLLSIRAYLQWRNAGTLPWIGLSVIFFLAACLSKSAAVTLPLVLVAIDFFIDKKQIGKLWLSKILFFLGSVYFGLQTFSTRAQEGHDIDMASSAYGVLDRFWMISQTILFYPVKLLLPFGFSIAYPFPDSGSDWPITYYLAPLALAALAFLVWKYWKTAEEKLFAIALYILPLSVMLPFRTVGSFELRSDRYAYISSIGVFLLVALLLEKVPAKVRLGVLAFLAVAGIFLSRQQSQVWNNGVALFENCVDKTPEAALCQCNLAYNELVRLDFQDAVRHYSETLKLDPTYVEAYNGRGQAYFQLQQIEPAYADFDNAIRAGLSSPKLYMNRGKCLVMTGRSAEAIPDFDQSLQLEPNNPEVYFFRGFCHEKAGNAEQAIADYSKAIEQNPSYLEPRVNRGLLHANAKAYPQAIEDYTVALQINPNLAIALNNRANAYLLSGQLTEALADASKCIETNPGYLRAYETRSSIYLQLGRNQEAQADLQTLSRLQSK